jgi:ubiquinone/menaquinone biosynthesis C-methylase UbiE
LTSAEHWSEQFRAGLAATGLAAYDEIMAPRLFDPWAGRLLDLLDVVPGMAVLDIACGPGTVARLAAARVGPYGSVTACDLSPGMLALAAAKPPVEGGAAIEYIECPADALPVADCAYDIVTCQHGLQFFPDRLEALAEMRRAARPGARVGVAAWAPIKESPVFAAVHRAVERAMGPDAAATYRGGPWALDDRAVLHQLSVDAGLGDVEIRHEVLPLEFEGGAGQVLRTLTVAPIAQQVAALDEEGRMQLLRSAEEELAPMTVAGALRSECAANILLATV